MVWQRGAGIGGVSGALAGTVVVVLMTTDPGMTRGSKLNPFTRPP